MTSDKKKGLLVVTKAKELCSLQQHALTALKLIAYISELATALLGKIEINRNI
jgi:hypothetical protein